MEWISTFDKKPSGFSDYQKFLVQTVGRYLIAYYCNGKFYEQDTMDEIKDVRKWIAIFPE